MKATAAAPTLLKALRFAHEVLEYAVSVNAVGYCECEACQECGKSVDECSGTECARTCQCGHCLRCRAEMVLETAEQAISAARQTTPESTS